MEKRDYCFDYIRGQCENYKCQNGHVIVENKEEFLKKHEHRIKIRFSEYQPNYVEIDTCNKVTDKVISRCVKCGMGFLVNKELVLNGAESGIKCKGCVRHWF
jgi:hypothetical protein